MLKLGIIFGEIPLVVDFINLAWEHPLGPCGLFWQLIIGLSAGGHLEHHIWEEPIYWLISATWHGSAPGCSIMAT